MKIKTALLLSCTIMQLFFLQAFAQGINVTGRVTNKTNGDALPFATVTLKGTLVATQTDANGYYKISVPKIGSSLIFSYAGMIEQEIPVSSSTLNVQLDAKAESMNEVVVVGYGTQRKATVTGAISSVKAGDLDNQQVNRIEQSLEGRTSGVTVAQSSGSPGASATVRIRGITSINNSDPLYIVDGVPVDIGGIDYLNQYDIESIEVLKDAASAAIYGTRAAG